jgi:hypothetical protein
MHVGRSAARLGPGTFPKAGPAPAMWSDERTRYPDWEATLGHIGPFSAISGSSSKGLPISWNPRACEEGKNMECTGKISAQPHPHVTDPSLRALGPVLSSGYGAGLPWWGAEPFMDRPCCNPGGVLCLPPEPPLSWALVGTRVSDQPGGIAVSGSPGTQPHRVEVAWVEVVLSAWSLPDSVCTGLC